MTLKQKQDETISKHLAELDELQSAVMWGDWSKVAEKTGLTSNHCQKVFKRIASNNHLRVVQALREVIEERIVNLNK